MGDHTESMQVDFNPDQIDFAAVAELFWKLHNPCATPYSRQYMTAIWYHDDQQRDTLFEKRDQLQARLGSELTTPIEPANEFYLAEDYHQKYRLQSRRNLMAKFEMMYPNFDDFNDSTAAARLNGLVGGGSTLRLQDELDSYGFTIEELKRELS